MNISKFADLQKEEFFLNLKSNLKLASISLNSQGIFLAQFICDSRDRIKETLKSMLMMIWDKVFKSGPSKICGRQPLKNLKGYGLLKQGMVGLMILRQLFLLCDIIYVLQLNDQSNIQPSLQNVNKKVRLKRLLMERV